MRMSVPSRACDGACRTLPTCPALIITCLQLFWKARWRLWISGPACFFPRGHGMAGEATDKEQGIRGGGGAALKCSLGRLFSDL